MKNCWSKRKTIFSLLLSGSKRYFCRGTEKNCRGVKNGFCQGVKNNYRGVKISFRWGVQRGFDRQLEKITKVVRRKRRKWLWRRERFIREETEGEQERCACNDTYYADRAKEEIEKLEIGTPICTGDKERSRNDTRESGGSGLNIAKEMRHQRRMTRNR